MWASITAGAELRHRFDPAKRITIAWNGRRELARAVFDALPLLKLADDINIVLINPDGDRTMAGDLPIA